MTGSTLTQAQAARAAGVSRTSIWRAIKSGRLSATAADDGSVHVDASELLRVYPQAELQRAVRRTRTVTRDDEVRTRDDLHSPERVALQALIDELRMDKARLLAQLEQAHEERTRLLAVIERQNEQVRLLTDDRVSVQVEKDERPRRRWWKWILAV